VIPDEPVKGIKEAIEDIRKAGYEVVVVSTRCDDIAGMLAICEYLEKHGIEVDKVSAHKPPAICYIDDRAICFDGRADLLKEKIEAFQPWYMNLENASLWFKIMEKDGVKTYICSNCGLYFATFGTAPPKECPNCYMRMKGE
jgi:hypothetical protein